MFQSRLCFLLILLLQTKLPLHAEESDNLHGKLTPWDVEGMYAQANAILEDKTIQNVSGVPAMLEACARSGHVPAQRLLLDVYEGKFKGLQAHPDKAQKLAYHLASAQPNPNETEEEKAMRQEASFRYALYCERGYGCPKDPAKAYKWMRKTALTDMSKARVELARYLINGIGHSKAPRQALRLLREQARKAPQTPKLYYYLGYMCSRGIGLRRPNQLMAQRFYEKGASLNDPDATNNLAAMYEQGIVVSQDRPTAIRLYKKAADLGSKEASANMQRLAFKTNIETAITTTSASRRICNAFLRLIDKLPIAQHLKKHLSAPLLQTNTHLQLPHD